MKSQSHNSTFRHLLHEQIGWPLERDNQAAYAATGPSQENMGNRQAANARPAAALPCTGRSPPFYDPRAERSSHMRSDTGARAGRGRRPGRPAAR